MGGNGAFHGRRRRNGLFLGKGFSQTHLAGYALDHAPFALLAEHLALEPVELLFEHLEFTVHAQMRVHQIDDLLRAESGSLFEAWKPGIVGQVHDLIIPLTLLRRPGNSAF